MSVMDRTNPRSQYYWKPQPRLLQEQWVHICEKESEYPYGPARPTSNNGSKVLEEEDLELNSVFSDSTTEPEESRCVDRYKWEVPDGSNLQQHW